MNEAKKSDQVVAIVLGQKLGYGSVIKAELFEEALGIGRTDPAYQFMISRIRRGLYKYGFYLDGEGFAQTGCYQILEPQENQWVVKLAIARAERDFEGKKTLLINTDTTKLGDLQRRRHEGTLREVSIKLDMMRKAKKFAAKLQHTSTSKEIIDVETEQGKEE
jgi:hypothetical protein